jgi:nucleotide-binding universal stress UspA family protein
MFKRLIVATDLSPASDALVECLDQLQTLHIQTCLLVQCLSAQETASIALSTTASILEKTLQRQRKQLESYGFEVETRIVPGQIKHGINRIALNEHYDLIAVGAQKQSAASEVFFKGLAYDLALHAKVPILLVRLDETNQRWTCPRPFSSNKTSSVLFPTDFSPNADLAFQALLNTVKEGIARVTLIHVQDKGRMKPDMVERLDEFNALDQEKLEMLRKQLMEQGATQVDLVIPFGDPAKEILRIAEEQQHPLIVMGSQGRGFIREIFLGSVSRQIARNANASILLVPAKR